jgi:hypothetical protein
VPAALPRAISGATAVCSDVQVETHSAERTACLMGEDTALGCAQSLGKGGNLTAGDKASHGT